MNIELRHRRNTQRRKPVGFPKIPTIPYLANELRKGPRRHQIGLPYTENELHLPGQTGRFKDSTLSTATDYGPFFDTSREAEEIEPRKYRKEFQPALLAHLLTIGHPLGTGDRRIEGQDIISRVQRHIAKFFMYTPDTPRSPQDRLEEVIGKETPDGIKLQLKPGVRPESLKLLERALLNSTASATDIISLLTGKRQELPRITRQAFIKTLIKWGVPAVEATILAGTFAIQIARGEASSLLSYLTLAQGLGVGATVALASAIPSQDKLSKIKENALNAIKQIGEESPYLIPAVIDVLERRDAVPYTLTGNIDPNFFLTQLNNLLKKNPLDRETIQNIQALNFSRRADPVVEKAVQSLLGDSDSLSQAMLITALTDEIRGINDGSVIPDFLDQEGANQLLRLSLELGQQRHNIIKQFSSSDPLATLSIALPASVRLTHPDIALTTSGKQIPGICDASNFGNMSAHGKGNRGNKGTVPMMISEFWKRFKTTHPQSYINRILTEMAKTPTAPITDLHAEIINSRLGEEAIGVIGYFAKDHFIQEGGEAQGAVKHLFKGIFSSPEQMQELRNQPQYLLYLMSTVSSLSFYDRFASLMQNATPNTQLQRMLNISRQHMQEAQKMIVDQLFANLLQDPKSLILSDDPQAFNLQRAITFFISWIGSEKPVLLLPHVQDFENLYRRSGQSGMGEYHAFSFLYTLNNIRGLLPDNHPLHQAATNLLYKIGMDILTSNLGIGLQAVEHHDLTRENVINDANFLRAVIDEAFSNPPNLEVINQFANALLEQNRVLSRSITENAESRTPNNQISPERLIIRQILSITAAVIERISSMNISDQISSYFSLSNINTANIRSLGQAEIEFTQALNTTYTHSTPS